MRSASALRPVEYRRFPCVKLPREAVRENRNRAARARQEGAVPRLPRVSMAMVRASVTART